MNGKIQVDRYLLVLLAILSLATLWLALDGKYYWHDIRFLYAASNFSLDEIMAGVFNPHQAWGHIDEISTAGFYTSKYLHIILIKGLLSLTADPGAAMQAGTYLSALLVTVTVAIAFKLYDTILGSHRQALFCVASLLLAPVIPYMAGKFISEVPSLLVTVIALLLMMKSLRSTGVRGVLLASAAGVVLMTAGFIRLDSLFGPAGFCAAAIAVPLGNSSRRDAVRTAVIAFAICTAGYVVVAELAGISFEGYYRYFIEFATSGQKSVLMSLLGIVTFGGVVYLLAVAGLVGRRHSAAGFLTVWLLLTGGIVILICSRYMVEPRYLVQAVLPLAGLGGLGMEKLYAKVDFSRRGRLPAAAGLLLAVLTANAIMVRLMPYELDSPALLEAVREIQAKDANACILVPWAYTDYHFLRLVLPDARIFNVNMAQPYTGGSELLKTWRDRYAGWYGRRYIAGTARIHELLSESPVYYLGWQTYPPLQNARKITRYLGLKSVDELLGNPGLLNHLEQSAVWRAADLHLKPAGRSGQYEYFLVQDK